MKRLISIGIAIALSASSIKPVNANPAVLAPVAFCAGTAGVGCVLIGTVVISGVVYYIWQTSNGRKVRANAKGQVLKHTEHSDDFESEQVYGNSNATDKKKAVEFYKARASKKRMKYKDVRLQNGKFVCIGVPS